MLTLILIGWAGAATAVVWFNHRAATLTDREAAARARKVLRVPTCACGQRNCSDAFLGAIGGAS